MSLTVPPQDLGEKLSVAAAALSSAYTDDSATAALAARGTAAIEARCSATFDAGTTLTSMEFQFQVSDDAGVSWDPILGVKVATGAELAELTIAASAGNTVSARYATPSHKPSALVRLVAKHTGGAAAGDDAASATVRILP
jgi:hypothetical protein